MNSVDLCGNLVATPQMQETSTGKHFCEARIAVYRTPEITDFINLRAWEKVAERLCTAEKGDRIAVSGRLCVDEYETREHERRTRVYVNVFGVDLFRPVREANPKKEENYGIKVPTMTIDQLTPVNDEELPF